MIEDPENQILVYLRRIDAKLDALAEDIADLQRRMTALEASVSLLHGNFAGRRSAPTVG